MYLQFHRKWHVYVLLVAALLVSSCSRGKKPFFFLPLTEGGGSGTGLPITEVSPSTGGDSTSSGGDSTSSGGASAPAEQTVTAVVMDKTGTQSFNFQTTHDIAVNVTVTDPNGPVVGAIVNITDPDQGGISVFQSITDQFGNATGTLTVPTTSTGLELIVQVGDTVASQPISTANLLAIDRDIAFSQPTNPVQIADADADGVPDTLDYYPEDPTRASMMVFPAGGVSVVAFEDLYPSAGDADFNDFVVQVKNEEDRNAQGLVVRLRGEYRVLARGAGYKHNLFLNLPGAGTAHIVVRNGAGQVVADLTQNLSSFMALPVFPKSNRYFANPKKNSSELFDSSQLCPNMCNVHANSRYVDGYSAEIELVFDEPIPAPGNAPYDLFIYVLDKKKEIHFPGMGGDGSNPYIDSKGFPWGLKVPEQWNWPLEKQHIETGYPKFRSWYESRGENDRDWYLQTTPESSRNLYTYFSQSPIAAYLLQFGQSHQSLLWAFAAVVLTALIVLLFLKGRSEIEA
jgi:LruC domain-containing protein